MTSDTITAGTSGIRGHITLWRIDEKTGLKLPVASQHNQIQYSWGYIAAKQIGFRRQSDRPDYNISAIYIEYENQAGDPGEAVSEETTFPRDMGITYYNSLAGDRDYLRVQIAVEPSLGVSPGYEANLPIDQQGNQLTFFAQTSGTVGVHGKPFNSTSKVFAAALVAAPIWSDHTRDVVFARTVFAESNQVTKEPSSQIGITWDIAFE
jgi:hypothetical protein